MAPCGTGSLMFLDDVTAEGSSRINSVMYRAVRFAWIQPSGVKLIRQLFTVQIYSIIDSIL